MPNRNLSCRRARARLALAAVALFTLTLVTAAQAEEMTMSPHRIVLNAAGGFEDVQAVIRMAMQPGYTLTDYEAALSLNGTPVSTAFALRYCHIDDSFVASFDRAALQNHPDVIALANQGEVTATVAGWYTAINADGDSYRHDFSCTDTVEIVNPDRAPDRANAEF